MKRVLFALIAVFMGVAFAVDDAEAKRLGGGSNLGAQRSITNAPKPATPPAAAPAQGANPAQAAAKPGNRWLGPLAGLAAGLGLAYLFGDQLAPLMGGILLAVLAGVVVMVLLRLFMKPRQQGAPQGLQYAGLGNETVAAPPPSQGMPGPAEPSFRSQFTRKIPEGFNVDEFVRQAKKSFIALQAANDRGDLEGIRDMVTDELLASLRQDLAARGAGKQQTDVVTLDGDLLEVVTESGLHWASIRLSGMLREDGSGAPTPFEEIWNLQKPEDGSAGWVLAGIQQVA